jgi:hypothetical protein
LGTGLLDAQFDFNVYDASVSAFAGVEEGNSALERLVSTLNQSLQFYGHHNLMGYISGNQDRSRFISIASGDVLLSEDQKLKGWTQEIPLPDDTAYLRLAQLHAFNFSIPGIPVIYYGDEIGLHGAGDPDNRKMMRFEGWSENEADVFDKVAQLAELRSTNMAMMYGTTQVDIVENSSVLKIHRRYFDNETITYINTGSNPVSLSPPQGEWKAHFGSTEVDGGYKIAPFSFEILTTEK